MRERASRWNRLASPGARRGIFVVLHLNPRKRGSLEQQLTTLSARLERRDTPVTIVFAAWPPSWLAAELDKVGAQVRALDFASPGRAAARLFALLSRDRPALVHLHFLRASSPLVLAARLSGARVLLNEHVTPVRASRSRLYRALKRLRDAAVSPLVDARLAVSQVVAAEVAAVEQVDPGRIFVIENGVDVARFAEADGAGVREELGVEGPLIACVARLKREKGVFRAVEAMTQVRKDAVLAMVGDGPDDVELKQAARNLGVVERIRFLGLRDDVEQVLQACDVSIVPSEWEEAFGQAVAESMASGKAVVVSRSGAMPELVGETGLVVAKGDPCALADAINRLLEDGELRRRLGQAAQSRARTRFDLERWADRVVALYDRLIED
jgi:glycosyltransferase involved in cell wall biosynthesis